MSHFVAGILRIVIVEAGAATLLLARLLERHLPAGTPVLRRTRAAHVVLAALALLAWTNFGTLRGGHGVVHVWEQLHFYLGAKYLPEVGYFDIYKAVLVADAEGPGVLRGVPQTRDLHTFEEVPLEAALADGARVRAAFSEAHWAAFKRDWAAFAAQPMFWTPVVRDHGNTGSPAWALFARPLTWLVPPTPGGLFLLSTLDWLLVAGLFVLLFRTFGATAGSVALWVWALVPFCFDYLFGSFLRWDWLFATGAATCLLARGRPALAGLAFAYAVSSKLFPICFGALFAAHALVAALRTRTLPRPFLRFVAGAAGGGVLLVLLSSATLGGPSVWGAYKRRIDVNLAEKYYPNQYSLQTVYLQAAHTRPLDFVFGWANPREIQQHRDDVRVADHRIGLTLVRLALTALLVLGIVALEPWQAFATGPLLVLVWLTVNAYYWNMLALPALAWTTLARSDAGAGRRALAALMALHATLAAFYLYQHLNRGFAEGYFVGCCLLLVLGTFSLPVIFVRRRRTGVGSSG